jgi:hypothetical protein
MLTVNRSQFEQIKTKFAKLRSELNKDKLAEFKSSVEFFLEYAPYAPAGDVVNRQEWAALAKEVSSAHRASLINNSVTSEYSRYKANAALGGVDGHPDCQSHVHAELRAKLCGSDPTLRDLAKGLAGMTRDQLRQELPE